MQNLKQKYKDLYINDVEKIKVSSMPIEEKKKLVKDLKDYYAVKYKEEKQAEQIKVQEQLKAEEERIKAEQEEQERKRIEEERIKAEQEEQERKRIEEERIKAEQERKRIEEERIKAEQEEQERKRIEEEQERKRIEEERIKAEQERKRVEDMIMSNQDSELDNIIQKLQERKDDTIKIDDILGDVDTLSMDEEKVNEVGFISEEKFTELETKLKNEVRYELQKGLERLEKSMETQELTIDDLKPMEEKLKADLKREILNEIDLPKSEVNEEKKSASNIFLIIAFIVLALLIVFFAFLLIRSMQ